MDTVKRNRGRKALRFFLLGGGQLGRKPGMAAVLDELRQIAFARADQFVEVRQGEVVLAEAPPWEDFGGAVEQIRHGAHGVEVKFYDKQWALGKLADLLQAQEQADTGAAGVQKMLDGLRKELSRDATHKGADGTE